MTRPRQPDPVTEQDREATARREDQARSDAERPLELPPLPQWAALEYPDWNDDPDRPIQDETRDGSKRWV